jgi:hypothetical protein
MAGESWAGLGWLRFGAGEMVGYTSRPVGGVQSFQGSVRLALRGRRGCAAVDYLRSYI